MSLTISIVSHEQEIWLWPLLEKLAQAQPNPIERVIITHNLKPPDNWPRPNAKNVWPFLLIERINSKPLGFGANHNQAFSLQDSSFFAILNPDITDIAPDMWAEVVSKLSLIQVGLTFPQLMNIDGSKQDNQRPLITPWSLVRRHFFGEEKAEIQWVSGACMVFLARAFRELGGFDEGYHMYCEDVDLCIRLQLAGWKLSGPHGTATHAGQRSSQKNSKNLQFHLSSLLRLWTRPHFWRYWLRLGQFQEK
jgi:N-acetylglucosaminyl-diphospho-decaprenol L-rhamnosyltransferase